jgi:hypothetical protein
MTVAVCRPTFGAPFRRHLKCLRDLFRAHPEWLDIESGGPCVDVVRNVLAEHALARGADTLVWLDADMTFTVTTVDALVAECRARQAIVGCLYAEKRSAALPQVSLLEPRAAIRCFAGGEVLKVEAIGFGVVAHPASILEAVAKTLRAQVVGPGQTARPFFTGDPSAPQMHSDDYSFCRRARLAGFSVYADARHRVGHLGEYEYHLEDCAPRPRYETLELALKAQEPPALTRPPALPGQKP